MIDLKGQDLTSGSNIYPNHETPITQLNKCRLAQMQQPTSYRYVRKKIRKANYGSQTTNRQNVKCKIVVWQIVAQIGKLSFVKKSFAI